MKRKNNQTILYELLHNVENIIASQYFVVCCFQVDRDRCSILHRVYFGCLLLLCICLIFYTIVYVDFGMLFFCAYAYRIRYQFCVFQFDFITPNTKQKN